MQRISLTLHPVDLEFFEKMAKAADVSKSRLIRQAMREFREKYEGNDEPAAALGIVRERDRAGERNGLLT